MNFFVLGLLLSSLLLLSLGSEDDLYNVLKVGRLATSKEIKASYRRLAKEWHPDKNKSPSAKEKFIQISTAYEVLSDDEKRRHYDLTGQVEDTSSHRSQSTQHGFTVFQSGNGFQFRFNFNGGRGSSRRKDSISANEFFDRILPGSYWKPYLLYFYHDFCMECMRVDNVWTELKQDLGPMGVGFGTLHTSYQPQVARHCSVSRVPTVVGVISGRVVNFNGWINDPRDIKNFLKGILPSVITKLTDSNYNSFLSDAIPRNRPRVIYFSRAPSPSLLFCLVALYFHRTLDFAYSPTGGNELREALRERFGVEIGERKLVVFKEDYAPVLVEKISELSRDLLLKLVEETTLYLPRISSQAMFDIACPLDDRNRLCALLVVGGITQYNDSMVAAFREAAKKDLHLFSYIDGSIQSEFLENFGWDNTNDECYDGRTARKILLLKRISPISVQFKWLERFCEEHIDNLPAHLSSRKLKSVRLEKPIVDEESPSWFERMMDSITDFYYYTFLSVINLDNLSPLLGLLFTGLLICMVGTFSGAQRDGEDEGSQEARKPESQTVKNNLRIYPLNRQNYSKLVKEPTRGVVSLVLLVDTAHDVGREVLAEFAKVLKKYPFRNLELFYLCYRTNCNWLGHVIGVCPQLRKDEIELRVKGCVVGRVATAVCLIGAKKQILLFPEKLETVLELYSNGKEGRTCCRDPLSREKKEESGEGSLKREEEVRSRVEEEGSLEGTVEDECDRTLNQRDFGVLVSERARNHSRPNNVGETLGKSLGYETSSDEEGRGDRENKSQFSTEKYSDESPDPAGSLGPVVQVGERFSNWMERLADGSLTRYSVEAWPDWT